LSFENLPRKTPYNVPDDFLEDMRKKYYKYTKEKSKRPISPRSYSYLYPD